MKVVGKVLSANVEERDLVGKDGTKRHAKITRFVLLVPDEDGKSSEVYNVKSFDETVTLPKIGSDFTLSRIKRYENFGGGVADVLI